MVNLKQVISREGEKIKVDKEMNFALSELCCQEQN